MEMEFALRVIRRIIRVNALLATHKKLDRLFWPRVLEGRVVVRFLLGRKLLVLS